MMASPYFFFPGNSDANVSLTSLVSLSILTHIIYHPLNHCFYSSQALGDSPDSPDSHETFGRILTNFRDRNRCLWHDSCLRHFCAERRIAIAQRRVRRTMHLADAGVQVKFGYEPSIRRRAQRINYP